jgi:hypothetical protein
LRERDLDACSPAVGCISRADRRRELNPDIAVKQLEELAYLLSQLAPADKQALAEFARTEARTAKGDYRNFLLNFPEGAGLLLD